MKIGVIVGHDKKEQGADLIKPYKVSEYVYNSEIAHRMFDYGESLGHDVEIFLRDVVGISGAYRNARAAKCDCVIELHFNSYNGVASGTETLCSSEAVDKSFAQAIQSAMCRVFDRAKAGNRGLKIMDTGRGAQSCVSYPGKANCLVEPAFGDHANDAKMLFERKDTYARALIDAAIEWCKKK